MIVLPALGGALRFPMTDLAMLDGLGIVCRRHRVVSQLHRADHLTADQTEIGGIVVDPITLDRRRGVRRYDVKAFGTSALSGREHLRIQSKLQDRASLGLARELRIRDLIR